MAKLYYQGHGSFRLTANDGLVVYVDPYAGGGYDVPADVILVSHQHGDHNKIELVPQKENCAIFSNREARDAGRCMRLHLDDYENDEFSVEAVEAYNKNHDPKECVGFIITIDGLKIYASGDTSKTAQMETFAEMELDYAILCGDGVYNMGPDEAAECARLIGAKRNIIIHLKPRALFDRETAERWDAPGKIIIEPGEEITL
ncbi:MAG: MBL fold metallo-hydrolase [Oscillospiraceae bacterium]|nr:MBL fold metallo-hydrolase [Oscillospiraceae bacterium]